MTRDPDSNRPRPVHRDYAGRESTRPGPHVDDLEATDDERSFPREFTPVDAITIRVATLEAESQRHAALLAETSTAAASREWTQMRADVAQAKADAALCRAAEDRRIKWARPLVVFRWVGGSSVFAALVWAVVAIGDAGAARRDAEIQRAEVRRLVDELKGLREAWIADHALLDLHLRNHP